jgi:hypothetical protein
MKIGGGGKTNWHEVAGVAGGIIAGGLVIGLVEMLMFGALGGIAGRGHAHPGHYPPKRLMHRMGFFVP